MKLRVVKLGGSQMKVAGVADRVRAWCRSEPNAATLMVVGGGPIVNSVRELVRMHAYDDEFLHWLCIDLMGATYRMIAAQLPEWTRVQTDQELMRLVEDIHHQDVRANRESPALPRLYQPKPIQAVVNVSAYYRPDLEEGLPVRLPVSWDTTSDSLAALLAHITHADELVLLKSCAIEPLPATENELFWKQQAERGVVDRAFPQATVGLKHVRCVDLSQLQLSKGSTPEGTEES